jgi:hypothetical protein
MFKYRKGTASTWHLNCASSSYSVLKKQKEIQPRNPDSEKANIVMEWIS